MTFYILINGTYEQVYVEIEPKLTKALDTTNDSFSCTLKANEIALPYEPMTKFKIVDDNNETTIMWITNDTVEVFSQYPLAYKHTLTLVQHRYFLNKHLVRNTVFNQPKLKRQKLYTSISLDYNQSYGEGVMYAAIPRSDGRPQIWYDTIPLNKHSKIKSGSLKYDTYHYYIDSDGSGDSRLAKNSLTTSLLTDCNASLRNGTYIRIVDANNSNHNIASFNIFNYDAGSEIVIPSATITAINNYIESRKTASVNVELKALYGVVIQSGDRTVSSYAGETIYTVDASFLNTLANPADTDIPLGYFEFVNLQVSIELEIYNYSMYDVVETLLNQYRLVNGNTHKRETLFNLPTSGELYNLLTTTYPPDTLSFTQATFYDALTEIFRFYDAGFKFDENETLDIEYYNNPNNEITPSLVGRQVYHNDKNYNNGRVAYYQNGMKNIKIPSIKTRANGVGVPNEQDYAIILPKPIYAINSLSVLISGTYTIMNESVILSSFDLDLSYFVVNESVWGTLSKVAVNFGNLYDYTTLYQEGTLKFVRDSNTICVSSLWKTSSGTTKYCLQKVIQTAWRRFFGIVQENTNYNYMPSFSNFSSFSQTWKDQHFNIDYETIVSGRLVVETPTNHYLGETIVNQGQGMVDLNKLGLNILGESLKDGEPVLTATCQLTNWDDRIKEGDYFYWNNERWVANVINYTVIKEGVYRESVEFVKNFNALALRTQTDNEKRLTNVSSSLSVISEDNYIDYVYVSDNSTCYQYEDVAILGQALASLIGQTFNLSSSGYNYSNIDGVIISTYDQNSNLNTANNVNTEGIYIPLIKYGSGNSICFEMQLENSISAGNQLIYSSGWFGTDKYFSQVIPYTDSDGWADKISLYYTSKEKMDLANFNYPLFSSGNPTESAISIPYLQFFKKPNEILALNYQLCFLPMLNEVNDFFIGSMFINSNAFVEEIARNKPFYIYYTVNGNHKYTMLDTKGYQQSGYTRLTVNNVNTTWNNYIVQLAIRTATTRTVKTWALCDGDGNIYFASNHSKRFSSVLANTSSIYFVLRNNRANANTSTMTVPTLSSEGTFTFTISANEWNQESALTKLTISDTKNTDDYFIDGTTLVHRGSVALTPIYYGKTQNTGYPICVSPYSGSNTNSCTWDSETFTFTYVIYYENYTSGLINATIYSSWSGVAGKTYATKTIQIPSLVGKTLNSYSISPASVVISNITYTNEISYNSATGTFTIKVNNVLNATDTTYTITYS